MSESVILTATPGGHLGELVRWEARIADLPSERIWLTARTPTTECLLRGRRVIWVPPVSTRQLGRALASTPRAMAMARWLEPTMIVSTGAAMTVPYVAAATAHGAKGYYIESATRFSSPSFTGKLMASTPGVTVLNQAGAFDDDRWRSIGSLFAGYQARPQRVRPVRKVVVTLGTEQFDFSRALRAIHPLIADGCEVVWQLGSSRARPPIGKVFRELPYADLVAHIRQADVVITHAGVASILTALDAGRFPIVLPRCAHHGEHVDDHQLDLAATLRTRDLALVRDPGRLTGADLVEAASRRVVLADGGALVRLRSEPTLASAVDLHGSRRAS